MWGEAGLKIPSARLAPCPSVLAQLMFRGCAPERGTKTRCHRPPLWIRDIGASVSALGSGHSSGRASVAGGVVVEQTARDKAGPLLSPARLGPARGSQLRDAIVPGLCYSWAEYCVCVDELTQAQPAHCHLRTLLRGKQWVGFQLPSREPVCWWGWLVVCARPPGQAASALGLVLTVVLLSPFKGFFFLTTKAMKFLIF